MSNQSISTGTFGVARFVVSPTAGQGTHTTIQAAITAASSGDTVWIRDGTYTENITLKNGVNLFSASTFSGGIGASSNVVIVGVLSDSGSPINCGIAGMTIATNSNFAIQLTGGSTVNAFSCYFGQSGANNNYFSMNAGNTIHLVSCGGDIANAGVALYTLTGGILEIVDTIFTNTGVSTTAPANSGAAIYIYNSQIASPLLISGTARLEIYSSYVNKITSSSGFDMEIFDSFTLDITLSGVGNGVISGCRIDSALTGLTCSGGGQIFVANCYIACGGGNPAITVNAPSSVSAMNNSIYVGTNAFTGTGGINTGGNVCLGGSGNTVSSISHLTVI